MVKKGKLKAETERKEKRRKQRKHSPLFFQRRISQGRSLVVHENRLVHFFFNIKGGNHCDLTAKIECLVKASKGKGSKEYVYI